MKTALTIAGSDPTGGAGLQADLSMFKALGVNGASIVSVVTAQNTEGVYTIHELPSGVLHSQLTTLLNDIKPDALKTGMLFTAANVKIISEIIKSYSLKNLVIDPVNVSSTGVALAGEEMMEALKNYLFPLSRVITPNINEAAALSAVNIQSHKDVKEAAVRLRGLGPESVIITGGHMKGNAVDLLFDGEEFVSIENEKINGEFHGTGCTFSAALTACLALGYTVKESFIEAKDIVYKAMTSAKSPGKGLKILNI
jgi:hydroxymethylpyrimidine kinase/phosphomethylpyrimidine kinase